MSHINCTIIHGFVATEPELRKVGEGKSVCSFCIGVEDYQRKKNDETGEKNVNFFGVTFWDRSAEVCKEYLSKGRHIIVYGRLKQDRWTDEKGENHSRVKISGQRMNFVNFYPRTETVDAS